MEIDPKAVGRRFKEAIDASKKTREDVGAAAGVKGGTITRWQSAGQDPRVFEFARACLFVGATPDAILGIDEGAAQPVPSVVPTAKEQGFLLALRILPARERAALRTLVLGLAAGHKARAAGSGSPEGIARRLPATRKREEK